MRQLGRWDTFTLHGALHHTSRTELRQSAKIEPNWMIGSAWRFRQKTVQARLAWIRSFAFRPTTISVPASTSNVISAVNPSPRIGNGQLCVAESHVSPLSGLSGLPGNVFPPLAQWATLSRPFGTPGNTELVHCRRIQSVEEGNCCAAVFWACRDCRGMTSNECSISARIPRAAALAAESVVMHGML